MYVIALMVLLASIDPSRSARVKEERVAISYPNPVNTEEAQLVRQEVDNVYVYRIKIGTCFVSEAYDDITLFRWSPDGKHFFFIAVEKNGQKRVVQDGRVHQYTFDIIGQIQFSNKSNRLVYLGFLAAPDPQKSRVVVMLDGLSINVFSEVTSLFFDKNDNLICEGNN